MYISAKGIISGFIDKLFDSLFKSLNGLFTDAAKSSESYEKGKIILRITEDTKLKDQDDKILPANSAVFESTMTLQWPEDQIMDRNSATKIARNIDNWQKAENISLVLTFKKSNKVTKENLTYDKAKEEINKYIEKYELKSQCTRNIFNQIFLFKEGTPESTNSSKILNIGLKKIISKTETSVELTKINANYDFSEALEDVESIVSDDDFVEQLPENEEICYDVTTSEDEYDVNECESFSCVDTVQQMINITIQTLVEIRLINITAAGPDYDMIRNSCETIMYQLDCVLSILSDILYDMELPAISDVNIYTESVNYGQENAFDTISQKMKIYLDCLDVVYSCCSKGNQSKLDYCIQSIEDAMRTSKKRM